MDEHFDQLARSAAAGVSRRDMLRRTGLGLGAAILALMIPRRAGAQLQPPPLPGQGGQRPPTQPGPNPCPPGQEVKNCPGNEPRCCAPGDSCCAGGCCTGVCLLDALCLNIPALQ